MASLGEPTDTAPNVAPSPPESHWRFLHTAAVVLISGFLVWMALWLPWGLYTSWLVAMAALSLFTLVVGLGVTGTWKGAFIDERLRVSLSRLQMAAWTVLIVAALGSIAIARAQHDPSAALDIAIPETVWLLLGISTTSLIGSPLIKQTKKDTPVEESKAQALIESQTKRPERVTREGEVMKNKSIEDASIADLFMGELVDNFALFDIGKVQMFFFTVLLLLAYGSAVGQSMSGGQIPDSLPDVGAGMLPLLGISHAGYLMSKVAASAK